MSSSTSRPRPDPSQPYGSFVEQVQDALAHLHDPTHLETHPLARGVRPERPRASTSRGRALRQSLLDAIESLHPGLEVSGESHAWRSYQILTLRYVEALEVPGIVEELAISRSEYFRDQSKAIAAVAEALRWSLDQGEPSSTDLPRPPAATLPSLNLVPPPTTFIGRQRELGVVAELVRRPDVRLLTLIGAGGSGKTRLALEVARRLDRDFANGVYCVSLAPLVDPELVAAAIDQVLGIQPEAGRTPREGLTAFLKNRHLLLLLDNFEHLLSAAPLVSELIGVCPRLTILVTSRAVLGLSGEHVYPLPPFPVPDPEGYVSIDDLMEYDAVRLFVERARAARTDSALTSDNGASVAEICRRLDGLPLAIELAAARARLLPPPALLARLENRLRALTGGARDLPARQRTLRDTIRWSYDLLTPAEGQLFRRLAVFAGGWTLEAAEAVCNHQGDLAVDVLDGMASLADKSLLQSEALADKSLLQSEALEEEPRLSMLMTIREYAREQLATSGEAAAIQGDHAAYYLTLAAAAAARMRGAEQFSWFARLDRELDNLRSALAWCLAAPERTGIGLRLAIALGGFWEERGYWSEGQSWLERLLAHAHGVEPWERAKALMDAGNLANLQNDQSVARGYAERSLALWRQQAPGWELAGCLRMLGRVLLAEGDLAGAAVSFEEDREIAIRLGDRREAALAVNILSAVSLRQGDFATARVRQEEALAIFRELDDLPGAALVLWNLGLTAEAHGEVADARARFRAGLDLSQRAGDRKEQARCLFGLARVAIHEGDDAAAEALAEESLGLFRRMAARPEVAQCLSVLALVKLRHGDVAAARALYEESLMIRRVADDEGTLARSMLRLAAASSPHPATWVEQAVETSLVELAETEARRNEPPRAARWLGAIHAIRPNWGLPTSENSWRNRARAADAVRSSLSDPAFDEAWQEGETLSLEQAVAEALEALDSVGSEGEIGSTARPHLHC